MPTESNAAYSNGHLLFTRNGFRQIFNPITFALSDEPVPRHARAPHHASWSLFDVSSNGMLAYQAGTAAEGNQMTWDLKGQKIEPSATSRSTMIPSAFRPTAARWWWPFLTPAWARPMWIYDVKRNVRTRFTTDPAVDNNPVWSPDGSRIVFCPTRRTHVSL
jgi:dipeptidyl aminopeptidase/acylaminoacyl peptidase